jgi:hypothetical protein
MILSVGTHRVTNASIEDPVIDEMLKGVKIDILYSDPPWGDGNMKYWVTLNKKMTGKSFIPLTYQSLINRIFDLATKYVSGYVCIETGLRWEQKLISEMNSRNMHHIKSFLLQYKSGSKMIDNVMVVCGTSEQYNFPFDGYKILYPYYGKDLVNYVISQIPGKTVLDPCCGMGYTANAAVNNCKTFFGNEFNSKRLDKTITILESSTR